MRQVQTETKARQQPADVGASAALAPLPPSAIAWRRRAIRLCWLMTFVGGLGLSAIPGPKASSNTVTYTEEAGRPVPLRKYSYTKPYGIPFVVARSSIDDAGNVKDFTIKGDSGIFGNFAVAFAISFGLLALWGRRRRET